MENEAGTELSEQDKNNKTLTLIVYALYGAAVIVGGITAVVAVIVNYVKQDDVAGTFMESHFRWQIRTFWFSLLWGVIGLVTSVIFVGFFILLADAIWIIYRVVKGAIRLNDNKPMYAD